MKITGATWNAFLNDADSWPGGDSVYMDDICAVVNGIEVSDMPEDISPTDKIDLQSGYRAWQGTGDRLPFEEDLVKAVRKFIRLQTVTQLAVEVPNTRLDEVKAYIKNMGGKVFT